MIENEKQLKAIDRSIDRAIARHGWDEDIKLSLFIRVSESRIYNGKPVYKALLKEVIFLRMLNLTEGDLRVPKGTPWSSDYRKYEGWCFAKQEYLANRVGCEYKYANRVLGEIVKDGYLKTRKWRDKHGRWHKQHFPVEAVIDAKIAELGAEEAAELENPIVIKTSATRDNHDSPLVIKTSALSSLEHKPIVINTTKEVSEVCSLGVDSEVCLISTPPSASPSGDESNPSPASQGKTKPRGTTSPEPPVRVSSLKPEEKTKTGKPTEAICSGHRAALADPRSDRIKVRETITRCGKCKAVALGLNENGYTFYRHPVVKGVVEEIRDSAFDNLPTVSKGFVKGGV